MAVGTRYLGDNLDTEATRSCQRKTTKRQQTGIRPMVIGAQQTNSGLKAEANHYIREPWRKGKSLKNASGQLTGSDMIVVLQGTVKPMVSTEH